MKNEKILDSWKAISNYLDRDIRTCHRWERNLGLPVHRIDSSSPRSKVFAYKSEIDQWLKDRTNGDILKKKPLLEKRWAVIGSTVASSLLALIFILSFVMNRNSTPSLSNSLSMAVFPFENLNSSDYDEYFSSGITNELINYFTRLSRLRVYPANPPKGLNRILEETGEISLELDADYLLTGKINKNDEKIKIYITLTRIRDGKSWDSEHEGNIEDIFLVQENICKEIKDILKIKTDQDALSLSLNGNTHDFTAFDSYLKGNFILENFDKNNNTPWKLYHKGKYHSGKLTQNTNELAIVLFKQAIDIDPNFTLAYIGLAQSYINFINCGWNVDIKWINKAEELLEKAKTLFPDLPEYYSTIIEASLVKEFVSNENTITHTLELAHEGIKKYPNHPQLNSIVGYCYFRKFGEKGDKIDFENALEYKERSYYLNPFSLTNLVYIELLMLKKDFRTALKICKTLETHDSSLLSKSRLGEIYYYQGDLQNSKTLFQQYKYASLSAKIDALLFLAMIAAQSGDKKGALQLINDIQIITPEDYYIYGELKLASTYMGLGMKEKGYEYLQSFFSKPFTKKYRFIQIKYIDIDKNFDKVREEKKFRQIIKGESQWLEARLSE